MSKYLSQNEIDSLLESFTSGDLDIEENLIDIQKDEDSVYVYDFKRPNRISKDQIRTLHSVHDSFSRNFSNSLSSILRSFIEVQVESLDQVTYSEVIMSMPSPTVVYVFTIKPHGRQGFIEINLSLVSSIIDKIFGGRGSSKACNRELTMIDEAIMKRITSKAVKDLRQAWEPFYNMDIKLNGLQTNPRFLQISFQNDIVLYISFKVIMEQNYGFLNLCIPYLTLEPMMKDLTGQKWFDMAAGQDGDKMGKHLKSEISSTELEVVAQLGKGKITVGDLLNLEAGNVIKLDTPVDLPISISVNSVEKMKGFPGLSGLKKAVQIIEPSKIIDEES